MLTLLEPCIVSGILDRPHLGSAMLIAACQEKGIKTTLVKGQTRYLKDMFINDSGELWNLIQDLKEDDLKEIKKIRKTGISDYKKSIQEKGIEQFKKELSQLYQYAITDKNPRHYFNAKIIREFNYHHNFFIATYFYYLTKSNYNIKIVDHYISEIIKSHPRYLGCSLVGSFGLLSRAIRKRIKELIDIPIIIGGSLTPFIDLKNLDKIFEEEYFDYLVIGAGDYALPALIEALDNKREPKGIANVFYKKEGKIYGNELKVIDNLDNLSLPDYSQFDLDLYLTPKRILPLQTARGCSWRKCAFCSHHNIDFWNYKTLSIERVIATIKHLQSTYNCSHFAFHDEELPPARAKRISEAILNNNLENIYINCYARAEEGFNNNKLLSLMRRAGFTLIHWGMESGCQRVLDLMDKGTKLPTISGILKKSSKNKIANICFIMFGFPGETKEEAQQTIRFLKKHSNYIEVVIGGVFRLELQSPIGKNPEKWNIKIKKDGNYSTKIGMTSEEADNFFFNLFKEATVKKVKITSNKLEYILPGYNLRMLYFFNASYELLSKITLSNYLKNKKLNKIFPILLGEVKKEGFKTKFYPVNINENCFINRWFPGKEKTLNNLEERIFIMSDGTLFIRDIIMTIYDEYKKEYKEEYIYKECAEFFRKAFTKNWGLGFSKSWRWP